MKAFTIIQKRSYIKNPNVCPFCQTESLDTHEPEFQGNVMLQDVFCACGASWTDSYKLFDMTELETN